MFEAIMCMFHKKEVQNHNFYHSWDHTDPDTAPPHQSSSRFPESLVRIHRSNLPAHFLFASPRGCLNPAEAPTASPAPSTEQPPALLLAKTWSDQDIEGWWMSEKLDGLRAYWNGRHLVCPAPREDVHRWICILAHPICVCGCGC